jgi:hypothetical protein
MSRYTVRVTSLGIYHCEPGTPLYWHFVLDASSEADAIAKVRNSPHCRDMPTCIVPPLGTSSVDFMLAERRAFDAIDYAYWYGDRMAIRAATL